MFAKPVGSKATGALSPRGFKSLSQRYTFSSKEKLYQKNQYKELRISMPTVATLCYIIKDGKTLLIKKKRGLGAGLWNGPGGRVEEGESEAEAASREVFEEVGLVPDNPKKIGELEFFLDKKNGEHNHWSDDVKHWRVHVFVSHDCDGIEKETEEATPKWFAINKIPYDEMWQDDKIWMPLMFDNKNFRGTFRFDGNNNIIDHKIEVIEGSVV